MRWRRDPSRRALVKECEKLLADLPTPAPFSIEALVRKMEGALGRQIRLVPLDDPDGGWARHVASASRRRSSQSFSIVAVQVEIKPSTSSSMSSHMSGWTTGLP